MKKWPWLSLLLLLLAHMGFGAFLHSRHSVDFIWWLAVAYAVIEAAVLTILWKPLRNFLMLGFQSDHGFNDRLTSGGARILDSHLYLLFCNAGSRSPTSGGIIDSRR